MNIRRPRHVNLNETLVTYLLSLVLHQSSRIPEVPEMPSLLTEPIEDFSSRHTKKKREYMGGENTKVTTQTAPLHI